MELHRLDGLPISGLDNVDIQDIDMDGYEGEAIDFEELDYEDDDEELDFSGLGYVRDPIITHEILDEHGNVIMYADADENLYTIDGFGQLGLFKKIGKGLKKAFKSVKKAVVKPVAKGIKNAAKFTAKKVIKPVMTVVNKFNPATILLRNGFLLAMKTNLFKVAERLRFGYLSDAEARRRGVDMNGFAKLKKAVDKAGDIYKLAGGKSSNLRKAILSGKGNSDKAVPLSGIMLSGLGVIPYDNEDEYNDEFERFIVEADADEVEAVMSGLSGTDGLGVVASTSVAAASSAVGTVAALLSKITGVFDKAKKVKDTVSNVVNTGKNIVNTGKSLVNTGKGIVNTAQSLVRPGNALPLRLPTQQNLPASFRSMAQHTATPSASFEAEAAARERAAQEKAMQAARAAQEKAMQQARADSKEAMKTMTEAMTKAAESEKSWFDKNKILVLGTGILLAGGGITYAVIKSKKKPAPKPLSGVPRAKTSKPKRVVKRRKPKKLIAPKSLL